ncbi:thioesterase family protein [Agrococcus versicolor]|uniref:Thioesterase family protein n=1 Tax=Agrococcus versicolor TaxID=501482 RepID=A0ABP5MIA6_9MICO
MTEAVGARMRVAVPMRWRDQDAFQHVNNSTMLTILEEARVRAFFRTGDEDAPATAILDPGLDAGTLTLIASHHVEYLAPVPYRRAPLEVEMWFSRIGGSSVELCYEVRDEPAGTIAVRAASTFVMVDVDSGRPRRLSDDERAAWAPFVGEPLAFRR